MAVGKVCEKVVLWGLLLAEWSVNFEVVTWECMMGKLWEYLKGMKLGVKMEE